MSCDHSFATKAMTTKKYAIAEKITIIIKGINKVI